MQTNILAETHDGKPPHLTQTVQGSVSDPAYVEAYRAAHDDLAQAIFAWLNVPEDDLVRTAVRKASGKRLAADMHRAAGMVASTLRLVTSTLRLAAAGVPGLDRARASAHVGMLADEATSRTLRACLLTAWGR